MQSLLVEIVLMLLLGFAFDEVNCAADNIKRFSQIARLRSDFLRTKLDRCWMYEGNVVL